MTTAAAHTPASATGSNFGFGGVDEHATDRTLTYIAAISEGLREEMRRDPNVLLMGEDIAGSFGGAFKVTKDFEAEFGARRVINTPLAELSQPEKKEELKNYLWGRFVIDLLLEHPTAKFTPEEFMATQKKLNIRLYSISSSQKAHPTEVHLTVATVRYTSHGRARSGVCSSFLAERVTPNETLIPCFVNHGKGFRLPEPHEETPIIMCGPGTGIAPFRAFLEERKATNAKGKAWLFFGEVSAKSCFFYKDEFEAYLADGTLTKLSTAWSRDQAEKIYVQHKMLEASAEFWAWLEQGAIFYVCGDASRMAGDVDKALHTIIEREGGKTPEEAIAYMAALKEAKRYRRDVY